MKDRAYEIMVMSTLLLLGVALITPAVAKPSFLSNFESTYPSVTGTRIDSCSVCHTSPPARNPYGAAWKDHSKNFSAIEGLDSDGDHVVNIDEINALTFPGDANDFPSPPTSTPTPSPVPTSTATPTPPADEDGDGIPDSVEASSPGSGQTNLHLPDSDGDGLSDGNEDANHDGHHMDPGETDPRSRDSDMDHYEDGLEMMHMSSDPMSDTDPGMMMADSDGDGLPDMYDPDDASHDTDGDRYHDLYEAVMLHMAAVSDGATMPGLGDVNDNGARDNGDSQLILSFFGNLEVPASFIVSRTDLDRDGMIDNADAQFSLNFFASIDPYLPTN